MLANVGQPVLVVYPGAVLRLSGVASALARIGALTEPTVRPSQSPLMAMHIRQGTIRGGRRA